MHSDDFQQHLRHFEQICKVAGLKLTHQRLEIYRELLEALILRHHHFFCDQCGQVVDFSWPAFETVVLPQSLAGIGAVHRTSAVIYGQCAACACLTSEPNASGP